MPAIGQRADTARRAMRQIVNRQSAIHITEFRNSAIRIPQSEIVNRQSYIVNRTSSIVNRQS